MKMVILVKNAVLSVNWPCFGPKYRQINFEKGDKLLAVVLMWSPGVFITPDRGVQPFLISFGDCFGTKIKLRSNISCPGLTQVLVFMPIRPPGGSKTARAWPVLGLILSCLQFWEVK